MQGSSGLILQGLDMYKRQEEGHRDGQGEVSRAMFLIIGLRECTVGPCQGSDVRESRSSNKDNVPTYAWLCLYRILGLYMPCQL